MIKVLVVVTSLFGYDGISNVATNYYIYKNHENMSMDFLTINPISKRLSEELNKHQDKSYILPYRNTNPIKYFYELKKIIKNGKYQIVHVHGNSSTMFVEMFAAKQAGVKVRIAHSHNTKCDHVKIDRILKPLFLKCYTDGFACGKEAGEWLFNDGKFDIISNGIDLEKFEFNEKYRKDMRVKYNLQEKFVIGHVGRFSEQKNHKKLIEIFEVISERIPDSELVLIGDGELKANMEQLVKDKKLNVLFVGVTGDVDKWLQAMDMMIFPSLYEGLPLGIVEAQAAGLPCILSDKISPMIKITNLVHFVSLNESAEIWVEKMMKIEMTDRKSKKEIVKSEIRNANYDIYKNCMLLEDKYKKILKQNF